MGRFSRAILLVSIPTLAAGYYVKTNIYKGPYLEENPFNESNYSLIQKLKYNIFGNSDNIKYSKSTKVTNPNGNASCFDYYQQTLDKETTSKILSKYKTNEEILKLLEKGLFKGPTLWFHQFFISNYFKNKGDFNRIAGFTTFEPELKKLDIGKVPKVGFFGFPMLPKTDKLKYVWNGNEIDSEKQLLPLNSVVYGIFSVLDYGKRSNGGYYDVGFGNDLLEANMVHRLEYEVLKNHKGEADKMVIRVVNIGHFVPPTKEVFTDETGGLHEFMTRTIVHDCIRELTKDL